MEMARFNIAGAAQWPRLRTLGASARETDFRALLGAERAERYRLEAAGLYLDYSRNLIGDEAFDLLMGLAEASPLAAHRESMFRGGAINRSERRPVLHTALRGDVDELPADELRAAGLGELAGKIAAQRRRIREISERIRSGAWLGATGKPVRDVVNLGIGGSDLGPRLACEALKEFAHERVRCHFLSNVDGEPIRSLLGGPDGLDPETTLFILASKSFTTEETLLNANTAGHWVQKRLQKRFQGRFQEDLAANRGAPTNPFATPHFIGITAAPRRALALGIPREQILLFDDWVGGRYSLWSAIGLSIAISAGCDNFDRMLKGAAAMDRHFRQAPPRRNMPVILALLGIWYANCLGAENQAVVPYCERLGRLPAYLRQLDMESNGKSVTLAGEAVSTATGPIVWGEAGTNSQHSFFQLLHQGTRLVPVDFIGIAKDSLSAPGHHRVLLANMIAQSSALMLGKPPAGLPPWRQYPGNRPSNVLLLERLTPEAFGALLALYEHKVFVQGSLWNINSFDQWGVELGKELARSLLDDDDNDEDGPNALDAGARTLFDRLRSE